MKLSLRLVLFFQETRDDETLDLRSSFVTVESEVVEKEKRFDQFVLERKEKRRRKTYSSKTDKRVEVDERKRKKGVKMSSASTHFGIEFFLNT